jgi:rhamnogalacturonyl hydrolase YesR
MRYRQLSCAFVVLTLVSAPTLAADAPALTSQQLIADAQATADAQLKALPQQASIDWIWAVMDAGYADFSHAAPDGGRYAKTLAKWLDQANWTPLLRKKTPLHADDFCIGQTILDLYAAHPEPSHLQPLQQRLDQFVESTKTVTDKKQKLIWSWCDALFMAPSVLARMSLITGDRKYIDAMDQQFWFTVDALYDKEDHLFYRDARFIGKKDADGKKIFWARGNGWAIAGIARVLKFMPANDPARSKYEALLKEMAAALAPLQQSDGTWHPSLLSPSLFDQPETSGTSLIIYGLACGIDQGVLDRSVYLPIVIHGMNAVIADRRPDLLPGYVQGVGDQPKAVKADGTQLYATGAFLLDAVEISKLLADSPKAAAENDQARMPFVFADEGPEKSSEKPSKFPPPAQPAAGATAFARYVPERMDDIAWENDRIAHRIYGPALQVAPHEHSGSGIDVWVKSVRRLVINEWYKNGHYHVDHGTGLDFYEVGLSRGDGGLGIWDANKLWVSKDWVKFKILDLGPDQCGFDLTYDPWTANGRKVWETRTETLKAGSNLDRIESTIHSDQPDDLVVAIGLARRKGDGAKLVQDKDHGLMMYWQPPEENGTIGVGVLVDPEMVVGFASDPLNYLILLKVVPNKPFVYYAGACWDRGLDFHNADQWEQYLRTFKRD